MSFAINKTSASNFIPPTPPPPPPVQQKPETAYNAKEVKMPAKSGAVGTVINTQA